MDFADKDFIRRTVSEVRRMAEGIEADPLAVEGEIKRMEKRLTNVVDVLADSGDRSLLAKLREAQLADLLTQNA